MVQLECFYKNLESFAIFKSRLLSFIRLIQSNVYNIPDTIELKVLTRWRLGCSRLNENKSRLNFQDCLNPLCSSSLEIEGTVDYLLQCHHFSQYRFDLIDSVQSFPTILNLSDVKRDILLYGDLKFWTNKNKLILDAAIIYIKNTEKFSGSHFGQDSLYSPKTT